NYRVVNYLTALEASKANPIFGIGYGNFVLEWRKYLRWTPETDYIEGVTEGNHSTFLGLLAETGLVGTILYLVIFYHMYRIGYRVYRKGEEFEREFALVFLSVATSYLIGANFSDYRMSQFFNTVLFLLFGTVSRIETQMATPTRRSTE